MNASFQMPVTEKTPHLMEAIKRIALTGYFFDIEAEGFYKGQLCITKDATYEMPEGGIDSLNGIELSLIKQVERFKEWRAQNA